MNSGVLLIKGRCGNIYIGVAMPTAYRWPRQCQKSSFLRRLIFSLWDCPRDSHLFRRYGVIFDKRRPNIQMSAILKLRNKRSLGDRLGKSN